MGMTEMKKGNVLVFEDSLLSMKLIKTVLESDNYTVLEARNAQQGIEMARKHQPDIILMDIQLPDMGGLEATRLIKSDPALKDIPVVAVTAAAMRDDIKQALSAGCVGHISKPIDVKNFTNNMEQLLE
jgi:CheY-like chemotaxis protein